MSDSFGRLVLVSVCVCSAWYNAWLEGAGSKCDSLVCVRSCFVHALDVSCALIICCQGCSAGLCLNAY